MDFSTPLFCRLTQTEEWKQNLFCWNILTFFAGRDGVGLMCRGRGMNTMHLTPTAWIQYMRARGEIHCWNLYCLGWWGQQLAKVDGGWCRYSRVWGSQACSHVACTVLGLLKCSWLPHVGCSVSFVIVFRFLLNFLYSQLLGELGSLVAPTWDALNLCNCIQICILYLVLALNLCILCIWGRWAFLVAPTWDAQTLCEGSVLGGSLLYNGEYRYIIKYNDIKCNLIKYITWK